MVSANSTVVYNNVWKRRIRSDYGYVENMIIAAHPKPKAPQRSTVEEGLSIHVVIGREMKHRRLSQTGREIVSTRQ